MARSVPVQRLQAKPCGETSCPLVMRELWAKAHHACMYFEDLLQRPDDPQLQKIVAERMTELRAAAKRAEPVMEVRLHPAAIP